MKVVFDLFSTQSSGKSKFHGGGEYTKAVFFKLVENSSTNVIVFFKKELDLDELIEKTIKMNKIKFYEINSINEINEVLKKESPDIFYSGLPYYLKKMKTIPDHIRFIYTIHGLRDLEQPTDKYEILYAENFKAKLIYYFKKFFKKRYIVKRMREFEKLLTLSNNKQIVVPSNHTKFSISSRFPNIEISEIEVLYSPILELKNAISETNEILRKYDLNEGEYLLLISGNRWIKNSYRAIKAISELYQQRQLKNFKTVILGNPNPKITKSIKNNSNFILLEYVAYKDLNLLYKNAYVFIYPTLNEGFGYPPLEAMKYKTAVLCSSISSVNEICENGAVYFNPFDYQEIKNRILQIVHDDKLYKIISIRGYDQYLKVKLKQDNDLKKLVNLIMEKDCI